MCEETFYGLFAVRLRDILKKGSLDLEKLQEVRLRVNCPMLFWYNGREYALDECGVLTDHASKGCNVVREDLNETLECISGYSLYAFDEEMKQGFLTVPGGHRIGVAGKIVMENGKIQCIRHISYINIRLSHQVIGCADRVMPHLLLNGEVCHTLIISPPRCGKTTLLRDIIRQISNGGPQMAGKTVGVVDERSELAGSYMGIPQNDLGMRTDVLECCSKSEGVMMLLRSMAPQVIAVDEIGNSEDGYALERVFHCGCKLIATVHGTSVEDIGKKPLLHKMMREGMFERYIILAKSSVGKVKEIIDNCGTVLYHSQEAQECGL